jgi:RHS repeat-associated protein
VSAKTASKSDTPSEKRYYYHSNHLGSVNVVTDDQGKVVERRDYKPYGDPFDWTGPRSGPRELLLTFDGQRYDDATGFYYFGARHYDPELGRFLTADTQVPDPMNPKTLHRYAFAGGNPIRYSDPTGHAWYDWLIGIFVVIALVVIGAIITVLTFGAAGPPLLVGLTLGLAFLGAGIFAAVALAYGFMPTTTNFWLAVAGGFALGAAIGAGLAALPAAIGGGFLTSIGASALVGAVFGGIETAIVHFVNGGGIEGLFGALFSVDALISAGIGAALGLVTGIGFGVVGHFGKAAAAAGKVTAAAARAAAKAVETTVMIASGAATLLSTWSWFYAGFMGRSFTEDFWGTILLLGIFMSSPPKSLGIPAWGFAGTWPGSAADSGAAETAALLQTMPLAP